MKEKLNVSLRSISYEVISECSDYISSRSKHRPKIGIICGSGLGRSRQRLSNVLMFLTPDPYIGGLADLAKDADIFPYSEIPGFPQSTVAGHVGRFSTYFMIVALYLCFFKTTSWRA